MSSKGSASDSAKIEVVRNPKVYAEPISIGVQGIFNFKLERAGGLVEEWTSFNNVSQDGQEQMLAGIATTVSAHFDSTAKAGLFLSQTSTSFATGASGIDLADSTGSSGTAYVGSIGTSPANLVAGTGTVVVEDASNNFVYVLQTANACVFNGQSFGAGSPSGRTISTFASVVEASGGSSGTLRTAGICDASTTTPANSSVFCATSINVELQDGDSLTTTYTLRLT